MLARSIHFLFGSYAAASLLCSALLAKANVQKVNNRRRRGNGTKIILILRRRAIVVFGMHEEKAFPQKREMIVEVKLVHRHYVYKRKNTHASRRPTVKQ